MTDKMRECPFCGSTAKELAEEYVSCSNPTCPMSAMSMTVESWNNRAKDAKPEADGKVQYWQWVRDTIGPSFFRKTIGMDAVESKDRDGKHLPSHNINLEEQVNDKWWVEITAEAYEATKPPVATVKPVEQVKEIEPWIIGWNTCRWEECVEQLQLRLKAVENEMRKR